MNIKILVSGATGFIGSHLINKLDKKNLLFVNRKSFEKDTLIIFNSKNEKVNIEELIEDEIIFIHLATHFSLEEKDNELIKNANLDFGNNILYFTKELNIKKIIYSNSMYNFYQENNLRNSFYNQTKNMFSKTLNDFCQNNGISYEEIYLDNTFGKNDTRNKIIPLIVKNINENKDNPIKNPQSYINITNVDYVVKRLIISIREKNISDVSCFISQKSVNLNSIYKFLSYYFKENIYNKDLLKYKENMYKKNHPDIKCKNIFIKPMHLDLVNLI